jgi:hypothetical protein
VQSQTQQQDSRSRRHPQPRSHTIQGQRGEVDQAKAQEKAPGQHRVGRMGMEGRPCRDQKWKGKWRAGHALMPVC